MGHHSVAQNDSEYHGKRLPGGSSIPDGHARNMVGTIAGRHVSSPEKLNGSLGPKMPAAFSLLKRKTPRTIAVPPIVELSPVPLEGVVQSKLGSSRSCDDLSSMALRQANVVPRWAQDQTKHNTATSVDLDDVLDLYLASGGVNSDLDDDNLDARSFVDATPHTTVNSLRSPISSEAKSASVHASRKLQQSFRNISMPKDDYHRSGRDRYGFRCDSHFQDQEAFVAWSKEYEQTLCRRRRKWDVLLSESGLAPADSVPVHFPPRSAKVQRYIRKGIPPEYRGHAWFFYSNAHRKLKENPNLYAKLVGDASKLDDVNAELIERDLHRTFPDNVRFKPEGYIKPVTTQRRTSANMPPEPPMISSLRRILQAFALCNPQVGYCQSLNFLAGMFLLFLDEEKSFWMLIIVTTDYLPNVHDANLEGANIDQAVLMLSIKEGLPAIWSKMGSGNDIMSPGTEASGHNALHFNDLVTKLPPITLVTAAWFMSAFTGSLPIETTLRVWDCFFYEGSKTLFRIALTILKLGEQRILSVQEPMEIFQVVQNLPKHITNPAVLMEACFKRRNGFGHLSQKDIDTRREKVGKVRAAMMSQRQSRDDIAVQLGSRQTSARSVRSAIKKGVQ